MNQNARGGYSPTPPEEDTGVPHASHGLWGQNPPSSSNVEGIEPLAPRRGAKPGVEPLFFRFSGDVSQLAELRPSACRGRVIYTHTFIIIL
jgi:hypothetical protein